MKKLSIVLATRNEEENIGKCLAAIKDIASEIIVFDEYSTDKTKEIAESFGAKVYLEPHHANFHITKQKAINKASGEWILQLDADEVVTKELAKEIKEVIQMTTKEILVRRPKNKRAWELMQKHQRIIEKRDKLVNKESNEVVALFVPRKNMFLGKPLMYGGRWPDPAIRLIKAGKARLPSKSVHEIMQIDGQVAWLFNDMEHYDSPTLSRYIARMNRYTDLQAEDLAKEKTGKDIFQFINYLIIKPKITFFTLFIRHKGFKDGMRGFLWALLSAFHFPLAYFKFLTKDYNN